MSRAPSTVRSRSDSPIGALRSWRSKTVFPTPTIWTAAAIRCGVTHFIESDPVQAILIAQSAPLLRVIWWNAHARTGTLIGASAWS